MANPANDTYDDDDLDAAVEALLSGEFDDVLLEEAEDDKVEQSTAHYRESPNGDERCARCTMFIRPNQCSTVQGPTAPQGWCEYFDPKHPRAADTQLAQDAARQLAQDMLASVREAVQTMPAPVVNVTVEARKKRPEITEVIAHDDKGRIVRYKRYEVEDESP